MEKWVINFKIPENFLSNFKKLHDNHNLSSLYEKNHLLKQNSKIYNELNSISSFTYQIELYDFLAGISYHEFGHSKECPIDSTNFSIIIQAISTALENKKRFSQKSLHYISNMFTDTIINTIYGLNSKNSFYRNSLFTHHFVEIEQIGAISLEFLFFVLLNIKLYQFDSKIRSEIEKKIYPKMPDDFDEVLETLISIFCPYPEIKENMILGVELLENEKWKCINYLSNPFNWDEMAYQFAKEIIDYIPEVPDQPIRDSYFTKKLKEDRVFRKEIMDKILDRKLKGLEHKKNKSKSKTKKDAKLKDKINDKNDQDEEKYKGQLDIEYGFAIFENVEFLDALYRYRTKKIKMIVPKDKEGQKLPITWMSKKILDENDDLTKFDPLNVYFLPDSEDLLLYRKIVPYNINLAGPDIKEKFPNLAIIYDDSGSMNWKPLSGTGKYDSVIIMIYSLFKWLKNQGFASVIEYNLTSFSTTTRTTGWVDYFHINQFLEILFGYEGGITKLDPIIFQNILSYPKNKVIILISDGMIQNASEIKKIIYKFKDRINLLHIQIGKITKFAEDLESKGFSIINIKKISKLKEVVLDFVKKEYNF